MKHKALKYKELGKNIVLKLYIFLIAFHLLSPFVFSTKMTIFSKAVPQPYNTAINIFLVLFLWFLYLAIKSNRLAGFIAGIVFHGFFLFNSLYVLASGVSFFNIEGKLAAQPPLNASLNLSACVINIAVIAYLVSYSSYLRRKLRKKVYVFAVFRKLKAGLVKKHRKISPK